MWVLLQAPTANIRMDPTSINRQRIKGWMGKARYRM